MRRSRRAFRVQGLVLPISVILIQSTAPANAAAPDEAQALFKAQCGVCHVAEKDGGRRQGPNLHNVFGRPAAALADFKYSDGLRAAAAKGLTWDAGTLDAWLADAKAVAPGTTMLYRQPDARKRAAVIDYLRTLPFDSAGN